MSNISAIHTFTAFDSKTSKALEGQRLAKITYKTNKVTGKKDRESICVSVPPIESLQGEIVTKIDAFMPYVLDYLVGVQDSIIKAKYEANGKSIHTDEIGVAAMLDYLEEDSKGGRLTKEYIAAWFNSSVSDLLTVALADKLGVSDTPTEAEAKKLDQMVAVYREKFSSLAGGKTTFSAEVTDKLLKVLELTDTDSDLLAARFVKRLEKMKEEANKDNLMGL